MTAAELRAKVEGLRRLWWCPAWGTLNERRYHGTDGPDDPNCGKVSYLRPADLSALLPESGVFVTESALAEATARAWPHLWVESEARGWHVQAWLDEDVIRPFENGDVAAAILRELTR